MSQQTSIPSASSLSSDRVHSKQSIHHSPRLISPPTPRSSHSTSMNPYSSSSTPNSSHPNQSSITSAALTPSYVSSMNTPTKYDFSVNSSHLHSTPSSLSSGGTGNNNANNNSYMHLPNQLAQTTYGSVKSESNASNYDYMNSCIQNGYFGSSFGSLGTPTAHVTTDLAGYHHQHHNVIQATKLMASS